MHLQGEPFSTDRSALATSSPESAAVTPPLLRLANVRVQFGNLLAVNDVSLSLNGGDFLGLLGANGAGKTTLMRAICGLQSIRTGDIFVHGHPLTDTSQHLLRDIGFTPDTPPLYEQLTARQFLRFIGRQYDLPAVEVDDRIEFWLEKLWLKEKVDTRIRSLSRGMRQRVGIARTMLPDPHLVVLDEPAAGLDPTGRAQFRQLLAELRNQGKALIVSSHVLSDLAEQCTHIALMQAGRLARFEPVAQFVGHATDAERCRYRLSLVTTPADAVRTLSAIDGITAIETTGADLTFEAARAPADAARLLKRLIAADLPVAAFAPIAVNLEQAYLRASGGQGDD